MACVPLNDRASRRRLPPVSCAAHYAGRQGDPRLFRSTRADPHSDTPAYPASQYGPVDALRVRLPCSRYDAWGMPVNLDLDQIAVAVVACPTVAGLHGGNFDSIATPTEQGETVGLVFDGQTLTVGVVGRFPASVLEIAAEVRAAIADLYPGVAVLVSVEDLYVPPADGLAEEPQPEVRRLPFDGGGRHRAPELSSESDRPEPEPG